MRGGGRRGGRAPGGGDKARAGPARALSRAGNHGMHTHCDGANSGPRRARAQTAAWDTAARRRLPALLPPPRLPRGAAPAMERPPSAIAARRLQSELREWVESPPEGCSLESVPGDAAWSKE